MDRSVLDKYQDVVAKAMQAFASDINYTVQFAESANLFLEKQKQFKLKLAEVQGDYKIGEESD